MDYPPPGTYVCRYSLVSGAGDWKAVKAYRTGMSFNQPLIPVSVVDYVSRKMLPPSQSLLSVDGDNLVVSSLKKLDSGPGIAYNMQGKIFEKFSRVKYKNAPKGVGLGLAFCRLAVEAHGGHIWVESEPEHGSSFIFTLPTTSEATPMSVHT